MSLLHRAYVGLGSNLQDPGAQLCRAHTAMAALTETRLTHASPVYCSPPMGPADQPEYLNAVVALDTGLEPLALLDCLQAIELNQGRLRGRHWGPRTLDLDLLLYDDLELDLPRLTLPHPGLHQRGFVLYPLADLAPELSVPGLGPVGDLLAGIDADGLRRIHDGCWSEGP